MLILLIITIILLLVLLKVINKYKILKQKCKDDDTNQPISVKRFAKESEADFDFKKMCREKGGTIQLKLSTNSNDPFAGTMLSCTTQAEYGTPENVLFSEIDDITTKIKNGNFKPQNEKERLVLYFQLVYPNSDPNNWNKMSLEELVEYYQDLEFYYKFPKEISPQTKVTIHRDKDTQFYRVPSGVILDQDPNRTGITTPYVEITRFGPTYSLLRDATLFNGTYYYPAKGSGLFLPVGNTLIGYNKVHVFKMLNTLNSDIVKVAGRDFQTFLQKDSNALWNKMKKDDPNLDRLKYWVSADVVNKHDQSGNTMKIWYLPEALDNIIEEMASGRSLRIDTRTFIDPDTGKSVTKDVKVYYGVGDTSDKLLAQIARNRGFDTLQFLRESQMSIQGDAIVGNEFLDLIEPSYSQTRILRLDPLSRPYNIVSDPSVSPKFNYLLDKNVNKTDVKLLTDGVFDPWNKKIDFDIVVPKRN